MASVHGCKDLHVRVVSRRLVMASDTSIEPHVVAVSNLDLLPQTIRVAMFCLYPKPPATAMSFDAVVATFERGWLAFLAEPLLPARRPHLDQPELRLPRGPLQQPRRGARGRGSRRRRGAGEPELC